MNISSHRICSVFFMPDSFSERQVKVQRPIKIDDCQSKQQGQLVLPEGVIFLAAGRGVLRHP